MLCLQLNEMINVMIAKKVSKSVVLQKLKTSIS